MQLPPAVQTSNNTAGWGAAQQSNPHLTQARGIDQNRPKINHARINRFSYPDLLLEFYWSDLIDPGSKLKNLPVPKNFSDLYRRSPNKRHPTVIRWFIQIKHTQTYQAKWICWQFTCKRKDFIGTEAHLDARLACSTRKDCTAIQLACFNQTAAFHFFLQFLWDCLWVGEKIEK